MFLFFFSSRRRHTRCSRDWSSDVCSSDLLLYATMNTASVVSFRLSGSGTNTVTSPHIPTNPGGQVGVGWRPSWHAADSWRSEEHTSELQSRLHLVCRLLLEKKNTAASRTKSVAFGTASKNVF